VEDGKRTRANLRNAGGAGSPSVVARNVRVRRGARDIDFGVVLRMLMRMLLVNEIGLSIRRNNHIEEEGNYHYHHMRRWDTSRTVRSWRCC
jgi:hypothetical protein